MRGHHSPTIDCRGELRVTDSLELLRRLTFKRAIAGERVAALNLFREVYARDVNYVPSDAFDEIAVYLIASNENGQTIASLRFLGPEFRPFEIEEFCDFSEFLPADRIPALVGRLSVRRDYRKVPGSIVLHLGLLKLAIEYASRYGITDLFLYTLPHMMNFYRSVLFRPIGCSFEYPALSAKMHVMRLELRDLRRRCEQSGSRLEQLLLMKDLSNFIL
jgi:hypothetical protein